MKMMYRFNPHLFINYFYFIKRWMIFILNHLLSQPVSFIFRILDFLCLHNLNIFQSQTTLLYFMFYFNQTWTLFFIVGLFTVGMQITSYIRFQQTFLVKGQLVNIFGFTIIQFLSKLFISTFVAWKQPWKHYINKDYGLYANKKILWTIKFKFHIIFMCEKTLLFCQIFSSIKKCMDTFLSHTKTNDGLDLTSGP